LRTEGNLQGQIFWLDGIAGTGKSTIAQTVACHYHATGKLGASFFCSRGDAECSNINMIFPTIAYQLCLLVPELREHVSEAIRKDPDLPSALVSMQLEKLIVEPLEAMVREHAFPRCLVVIDALDECKEDKATSTILSALAIFTARGRTPPLQFFITSRPVPAVERGFHLTGLMRDTNALVLHNIPLDISRKDIRIYLTDRLSAIARSFGLESWPADEAIAQLVQRSNELFIYAATIANFIEDQNASDPVDQLETVMVNTYIELPVTSPHRQLDALYLVVLREAFPNISERQRGRLQTVLGTIVLLFDSLDPENLEALFELGENTVRTTLRHLHSIVIVPDAGDGPVRLIHPSFHDFYVDRERCDDLNFGVSMRVQHKSIAERCLWVLDTLRPDMCEVGDPSLCNGDVTDLSARITTRIPAHMRYACRHWASHLSSGNIDDTLLDLLLRFCLRQLMNWVTVMSLVGELSGTITALQLARRKVVVRPEYYIFAGLTDQRRWLKNRKRSPPGPRL